MDTKRGVDNLCSFLTKANYNVISIHGDKKQFQRQDAINKFMAGDVPILIATDVASRGLDFPKVEYVFNYDMPTNIDDYVHRIGRTGRCGNSGTAISFINDINKPIIKNLYLFLQKHKQEIPEWFEKMYGRIGGCSYSSRNNYNNASYHREENKFLQRKREPDNSYEPKDLLPRSNENKSFNNSSSSNGNNYNSFSYPPTMPQQSYNYQNAYPNNYFMVPQNLGNLGWSAFAQQQQMYPQGMPQPIPQGFPPQGQSVPQGAPQSIPVQTNPPQEDEKN